MASDTGKGAAAAPCLCARGHSEGIGASAVPAAPWPPEHVGVGLYSVPESSGWEVGVRGASTVVAVAGEAPLVSPQRPGRGWPRCAPVATAHRGAALPARGSAGKGLALKCLHFPHACCRLPGVPGGSCHRPCCGAGFFSPRGFGRGEMEMLQGLGNTATCGEGEGGLWVTGRPAAPRVGSDAQGGPISWAAKFPGGWGPCGILTARCQGCCVPRCALTRSSWCPRGRGNPGIFGMSRRGARGMPQPRCRPRQP